MTKEKREMRETKGIIVLEEMKEGATETIEITVIIVTKQLKKLKKSRKTKEIAMSNVIEAIECHKGDIMMIMTDDKNKQIRNLLKKLSCHTYPLFIDKYKNPIKKSLI
jgi:hypothetical protein